MGRFSKFSKRALTDRCATLEKHVQHKRYATEEELGAYRPGGTENRSRAMDGLVYWYGQLIRFCGREEADERDADRTDARVLEALRNDPMTVMLSGDGSESVTVYQKSLDVLFVLHARECVIAWLAKKIEALKSSETTEHLALIESALAELSYHWRVQCWVVTYPGPGAPFSAAESRPDLPNDVPWLVAVSPWDCLRICQAYTVVNAQRLQSLDSLIASNTDDPSTPSRPSWSTFVGSLAMRLNTLPTHLVRDTSLVELLSMVQVHGAAERDAQESAKRDREADQFAATFSRPGGRPSPSQSGGL